MFKKMVVQKRRELLKDYEKQEKRLKELKSQGQSKKKAEGKAKDALTRKQQKNQVGCVNKLNISGRYEEITIVIGPNLGIT